MKLMLRNTPEGYVFISPEGKSGKIFKLASDSKLIKRLYKTTIKPFFNIYGLYKKVNAPKIPDNIDLFFSSGIPLDIKKPWILEILDHPACMSGYDYDLFLKEKKSIEKKLLSIYCKKIIVMNELSLEFLKKHFTEELDEKYELLRAGVEEQKNIMNNSKEGVQILFMGSLANPNDFYMKGGLEAVTSFNKISKEFPEAKLIIRCKTPEEIVEKYKDIPNIEFIEERLSMEAWENILRSTDIALQPGHIYALMGCLEPLSHGIPIVTLDTWSMSSYLDNNKNSFLIKPSEKITEYNSIKYPLNLRTKKFVSQIKDIDERVIEDISEALKKLILNKNLRKEMGENGKKTIREKFSIKKRAERLKEIFDEATR